MRGNATCAVARQFGKRAISVGQLNPSCVAALVTDPFNSIRANTIVSVA
jgi:hypothetical protein